MTYPMGIHRCLVFDGFETARFQKSRTKRSSKRLSIIMSSPPSRIDNQCHRHGDMTKVMVLYSLTKKKC